MTRLSLAAAEDLGSRALRANRVGALQARSTARALVAADADGLETHGVARVPAYAAQARVGKVEGFAEPKLERLRPGLIRIDAGHGYAFPALDLAVEALPEIARTQGIAAAYIARSHHFGQGGRPCEQLAEQGFCALLFGNAGKSIAPWGGRKPLLGTNPICFAAPLPEGAPLVIDMAVSRVARGKVILAARRGESIPDNWAFDPEGRPTTDARAALAGTMAPMGEAKGAALALMVEVLAAGLVGSSLGAFSSGVVSAEGGPPDLGQTLIAVDAAASPAFPERMAELAALYAEDGARMPGTRRLAARAEAARDGLDLPEELVAELEALAAS
ncbi:Ldh family oxidoreductase [Neomegalonema sp.]|uniref:Ldh family oxidoreductase n=1 Tax=Neomegalonema sp. TaxID=2039713 RepID=UPI0026083ABE|nr:Ldh family oxidoreductase [Neomegalonema sp.]MDD2868731.1 Ldh family oxidoreductase [Neomegalonema sp.]